MVSIRNLPHHMSECLANQRCRVCKRRNVLADLLQLSNVDLELAPFRFSGKSAQFEYEADEVLDRSVHGLSSAS